VELGVHRSRRIPFPPLQPLVPPFFFFSGNDLRNPVGRSRFAPDAFPNALPLPPIAVGPTDPLLRDHGGFVLGVFFFFFPLCVLEQKKKDHCRSEGSGDPPIIAVGILFPTRQPLGLLPKVVSAHPHLTRNTQLTLSFPFPPSRPVGLPSGLSGRATCFPANVVFSTVKCGLRYQAPAPSPPEL